MPYRVIKDDDVIESPDEVKFKSGVLLTIHPDTGLVETAYAPGFWDTVFWEKPE